MAHFESLIASAVITINIPYSSKLHYYIDQVSLKIKFSFYLSGNTSSEVHLVGPGVSDGEGVGSQDLDFDGFTAVKLIHALDFTERDVVSVLEAVTGLVLAGHDALLVIGDGGDHGGDGLLAVSVIDGERGAEVIKDLGEETPGVGDDELDAIGPGDLGHPELLLQGRAGEDDHGELADEFLGQRAGGRIGGHVGVQLSELLERGAGSVLADVRLAQVELGADVVHRAVAGVVEGDGLDAAQDDVLGDL